MAKFFVLEQCLAHDCGFWGNPKFLLVEKMKLVSEERCCCRVFFFPLEIRIIDMPENSCFLVKVLEAWRTGIWCFLTMAYFGGILWEPFLCGQLLYQFHFGTGNSSGLHFLLLLNQFCVTLCFFAVYDVLDQLVCWILAIPWLMWR